MSCNDYEYKNARMSYGNLVSLIFRNLSPYPFHCVNLMCVLIKYTTGIATHAPVRSIAHIEQSIASALGNF